MKKESKLFPVRKQWIPKKGFKPKTVVAHGTVPRELFDKRDPKLIRRHKDSTSRSRSPARSDCESGSTIVRSIAGAQSVTSQSSNA